MRISIYLLISMFMALFGFFGMSCNDYACDTDKTETPHSAALGVQTEVTHSRSAIKNKFTPGDQLGLFLQKEGSNDFAVNGTNILSTLSEQNVWMQNYLLGNEKLKLYAYYPYSVGQNYAWTDLTFTIGQQIHYMYGTHTPSSTGYVDADNPTAHLRMEYVLGVAEFFIRKADYTGKGKVTKIVIRNNPASTNNPIATDFSFNIISEKFTASSGDYYITLQDDKNGLVSELKTSYPEDGVIASVYTSSVCKKIGDIQVIFTIDGEDLVWHMPIGTRWDRGVKYSYYITLSNGQMQIENVTIEDLKDTNNDNNNINLK